MFAGIEKDGESVDRRELSSAEFVCSDICITHNHVHAPEEICNKIKMYFIDLFFSLRSSKANFSDKLSDKGTIDWFGSRKLIKASECQKRKEEVQLSKYWKAESCCGCRHPPSSVAHIRK